MAAYTTPGWANDVPPAIDADSLIDMGQGIELAEHPYGECGTAISTKAKTVTVNFSGTLALFRGLTIRVKFTKGNSAASPTLNVNGTGAKAIRSYGTTAAGAIAVGQIVTFVYDGSGWLYAGVDGYTKGESLSSATATAIQSLTGTKPTTPDGALGLLAANSARIAFVSYTGTGTYGIDNPTSITCPFPPKLVLVPFENGNPDYTGSDKNNWPSYGAHWTAAGVDLFYIDGQQGWEKFNVSEGTTYRSYGHFTRSGNTLSWYIEGDDSLLSPGNQRNSSGNLYTCIVFG